MDSPPFATEIAKANGAQRISAPRPVRERGSSPPVPSPVKVSYSSPAATARVLPDLAICRAEANGLSDYATCLMERPFQCPHALSFGWSFFCRHPQRHAIVRSTSLQGE